MGYVGAAVAYDRTYTLGATNLPPPPSPWPCLATNWFDANGSFTVHLDADVPRRLFMLKVP